MKPTFASKMWTYQSSLFAGTWWRWVLECNEVSFAAWKSFFWLRLWFEVTHFPPSSLLCTHVQSWDLFFRNASAGQAHDSSVPDQLEKKASFLQSHGLAQTPGKAEKLVEDHLAVQSLIRAYQVSVLGGRRGRVSRLKITFFFLPFYVVCLWF